MIKMQDCLRTRSETIALQKLDNNLIASCTLHHGLKILSFEKCEVTSKITHEDLTSSSLCVAISPNTEFLAFNKDFNILVMHIPSKTIIKTIKTDHETIELLEFDKQSKYIFAATKSGRILQYRYDGSSLLARLYSFNTQNTTNNRAIVSSFAFNKNIMACGGAKGVIFTINIHSRAGKHIVKNDDYHVNSICFINDTIIASGDVNGTIYFNSLKNSNLIKKIQTAFSKIVQILLMPNPRYIMVVGDENYVSIYDTQNFKLLHSKYIKFNSGIIKVIVVNKTSLLVALKNNNIQKINLPDLDILKSYVESGSLDKAFQFVERHLMVHGTQEHLELEDAYAEIYKKALTALTNQNKGKALDIVKMFKYTESKKEEIKLLFKAFQNYSRFKSLYIEKKHSLAYAMAEKFPPLKRTFQYHKMEEAWRDSFKNAQRQIAHGLIENANTLLHDYVMVLEKRPFVKLILNHNNDFMLFLQAIESKNFKTVEKLAKKNLLFTKIPTYSNIKNDINEEIIKIQENIDNGELDSAIIKLTKLQNIDSISDKINTQINECKAIKKLQDAYEENNFIECYEIIDKNYSLHSIKLALLLQDHWSKIISECENAALRGNIKDIKKTLGELINLSSRRDQIGDLFRLSFHTRIKGLLAKKAYKNAESIIYSYIDIFGIDSEIISIMNMYEQVSKNKLAISQNGRQSRDSWINSESIMGN